MLHLAYVQCGNAGEHTQQRGFTGAVSPNKSNPLADLDGQLRAVEQGVISKGELPVKQCDE